MKCLRRYKWVKLPRKELPELKRRLGYWLKLAESAVFAKEPAPAAATRSL